MHGNYRHHYLLSAAAPAATAAAASSSAQAASSSLSSLPKKPVRQQHSAGSSNFNGLPTASNGSAKINQSQILPSNYPPLAEQQQSEFSESQRFNVNRHYIDQQHRQVRAATVTATTGSREYCTKQQQQDAAAGSIDGRRAKQQLIHMNNNHHHHNHNQMILPKQGEYQHHYDHETLAALSNGHQIHQHQNQLQQQDNYASQIRNSRLQHRFQHQQVSNQMQQHARGSQVAAGPSSQRLHPSHSPASSRSSSSPQSTQQSSRSAAKSPAAREEKPLHVNFNRANHMTGEDEGDSRKKKYLTAKYGQQQMNLIKKRLKIEMWLCEQLQELAKGSKSEVR